MAAELISSGGESGLLLGQNLETIRERVKFLHDHTAFTDVSLILHGQGDKLTIPAHKAILSVGSPVFANIFFKDKDRRISPSEVDIKNVDHEAFQKFIEFLYTDEICFGNENEVIKMYAVAEKFEVPRLAEKCKELFLSIPLSCQTVCNTLQMSIVMDIKDVKARCLNFIAKNTSKVLRSSAFEKADLSTVRAILKLPELSLKSEYEVLSSATNWSLQQNTGIVIKNDWSFVRGSLEPLLPHIRFLAISTMEFTDYISRFKDIFTESESLAIIMGISNPSLSSLKLPSWCNRNTSRCSELKAEGKSVPPSPFPLPTFADRKSVPPFETVQGQKSGKDKTLTLPLGLGQNNHSPLSSLMSFLEVYCVRGRFIVTGLRLRWGRADATNSVQRRLKYFVVAQVQPSGFRVVEDAKDVCDQEEVTVMFSRTIYLGKGDTLKLEVVINDINGFQFLTYVAAEGKDKNDLPFICTLDCYPRNSNISVYSALYFRKMDATSLKRGNWAQNAGSSKVHALRGSSIFENSLFEK